MDFSKYGLQVPKTLLPKGNVDWTKWSVIAVDQYTSQIEYWDEVDRMVGNAPSTLRLVWPEAWLESDKNSYNPDSIKSKMNEYMRSDIFEVKTGFIHTQRTLRNGEVRSGLVANIDLECYEFNPKEEALIKSTEGTIVTRLPARIDVREKADLEVTHVMLLIDDRQNLLMEMLDRIDKDTSGLLVVAKTEFAMAYLSKQFFNRTTERLYYALVWGNVIEDEGTIEGNIGRSLKNRLDRKSVV